MSGFSEHDLFWLAKAGDRDAFNRLQEELETTVRRFIHRLVGVSPWEDDIVQDAFLALYVNIDRVENLRPFLFRVVRNRCYDELRRKGRFQSVLPDEAIDDNPDIYLSFLTDRRPPPDEELHWNLIGSEVERGINRLPESQRQTMILCCEEDLSYQQIAEVMATDIGTVKSRIHYATMATVLSIATNFSMILPRSHLFVSLSQCPVSCASTM